jgi:hypothetical protein
MENSIKKVIYNSEQVDSVYNYFIDKLKDLNVKYEGQFNFEKDVILVFNDDKIIYKVRNVLSDNIKNDVSELFLDALIKFNLKKIEDEK